MIIALPNKTGGLLGYAEELQRVIGQEQCELKFLERSSEIKGGLLFLQYSGYGYAKRGAPLWLLESLRSERIQAEKIGVYFHELYATNPPWSSAFWLSPVQRYIARSLVERSDFWMTSCSKYSKWLSRFGSDKPNAMLPMFSTVGEPNTSARSLVRRAVIFGTPEVRAATYRASGDYLGNWARAEEIELVDLGGAMADDDVNSLLAKCGVTKLGRRSSSFISSYLAESMFGLLAYDADRLAKSSIFAAYAAHAICPIVLAPKYFPADGLTPGTHYVSGLTEFRNKTIAFESVAEMAREWYSNHSIAKHVTSIQTLAGMS